MKITQKKFILFSILILLFVLIYLQFHHYNNNNKTVSNIPVIAPSYVIAIKGHDIPLHSEVAEDMSSIKLTGSSKIKSKQYIWTDIIPSHLKLLNYVNLYVWSDICEESIDHLIFYPLFPNFPSYRSRLETLSLKPVAKNTGMRIFGYIVPAKSSFYKFQMAISRLSLQFWLSTSINTNESKLIIESENFNQNIYVKSHEIKLEKFQKYYFDIVLKTSNTNGEFILQWKEKSSDVMKYVGKDVLYSFMNDSHLPNEVVNQDQDPPINTPMLTKKKKLQDSYKQQNMKRSKMYKIPFINTKDIQNLFPSCPYKPSYIPNLHHIFQGVWETHFVSIYPPDDTEMSYKLKTTSHSQIIFGNPELDADIATNMVDQVVKALTKKHKQKYSLMEILNIEENTDPEKGSRYLIELELSINSSSSTVRLSEYVYKPKDSNILCYPEQFSWNKNAYVNIVLSVGKLGRWVKHYIDTFARIYNETKDERFNIIIVDFDSRDIDIARALEESSIPNYVLLKHSGKFHRTSMQSGANVVTDENSIVITLDLHLIIPSDFIDNVRKHTIKGKMAYAPLLARLQCGASPLKAFGFWEISGYGIYSLYKSDFDKIGGMNIEKFKDKWGDEDWDMLDRTFQNQYEVERIKVKNFYHLYHTSKGLW